jgi:hypothetical protein
MSFSYQVLSQLVLLSAFALLVMTRGRSGAPGRGYLVALGVVAVASLLPHVELLRSHANGRLHVHPTEFYHYHLGTKYFAENGYYGLYEAAVVAEYQLAPDDFRPDETLRHLRRPEFEARKGDILRRKQVILERFTPERWREFESDFAFFRSFELRSWGNSPPERDHGYNGTPLTTAVLGGLANQPFLSTPLFVSLAAWFDLALILLLTLVLGRWLGLEPAFAFLALWSLNPLNDFGFTGGAYLRHLYFVMLALGVALVARDRAGSGAACLAASAGFRVFPALFPAAVVAHDLVNPDPAERIRRNARFYVSLLLVTGILLGSTWLVRSPDGRSAWVGFAERITRHAANLSPNRIGLQYALAYSADHELATIAASTGGGGAQGWREAMQRTLDGRRLAHGALLVLGALLSLAYLRSVPRGRAPFLGLLWLYLLALPSHYDYVVLGIIPIVFARDRRVWLLFAGLAAALLLLRSADWSLHSEDRFYAAASAAVGLFLAFVTVLQCQAPRALWSGPPRATPGDEAAA